MSKKDIKKKLKDASGGMARTSDQGVPAIRTPTTPAGNTGGTVVGNLPGQTATAQRPKTPVVRPNLPTR